MNTPIVNSKRLVVTIVLLSSILLAEVYGSSGQLWAFGKNHDGQLADGTIVDKITPVQVAGEVSTVAAGGSATEGSHTFYVKTDGTLWAVGYNVYGQLGDGTNVNRLTPIQVASGVSAVSAGINHSLFLKTDGTLWAMGFNSYGQLGDGSTTNRPTPVQIASGVSAIAAGGNHSLFLKTNGSLWAAGYNNFGQLGDGHKPTNQSTPVQIATGVSAIAAGGSHSLFLKTDSTLWVTGWNASGQLGVGPASSYLGTPAQLTTGVSAIAAGNQHSLYLKTNGTLWAMGQNLFGQLGDGSMPTNQKLPVQVTTGVSTVSAGVSHSLFLKTDGSLWAMGLNASGQLGDGTINNRGTPVLVTDEVLSVNGGAESSYFIKAPGTLTIAKADQTINFTAIPTHRLDDAPFALSAVASPSGLPVTFSVVSGPATVALNMLTLTGAGPVTVRASQSGNPYYNAASTVDRSFSVSNPTAQITWAEPAAITYGTKLSETQLNATANVPGTFTYSLASGTLLTTGAHTLTATFTPTDADSYFSTTAQQTLSVHKATATVVLDSLSAIYDGSSHAATATTTPASLAVSFTYDGAGNSPSTNVGTYTVVGTITDANYQGSATGSLTITRSTPVITWSTPAPIVFGTVLSEDQLNATANVAGTIAYNPTSGTLLSTGIRTLTAIFSPADTTNYNGVTIQRTLSVNSGNAPVITIHPLTQTVVAGSSITLMAAASGTPAPTYQWKKAGINISGATGSSHIITSISANDEGNYTVDAANADGSATSNAAMLTVLFAPGAVTISFAIE